MTAPVIRLENVHKRYRIYRRRYQSVKEILVHRRMGEWQDHWALRGISLDVEPGTTLALLGPNGAGKSTTLKLMARILSPDKGRVQVARRVAGLLELGAGFQLDYNGIENINLNASLMGLTKRDIKSRVDSIVEFSELGDAINDPLRTYSSGMYMRLAFSIAVHVDPDVLLVDEVLAVGDEAFQKKCLDHITRFQASGGTIVLVTHGMGTVTDMCNQAAWIEDGEVQEIGLPAQVVNAYVDRVREREAAAGGPNDVPAVELGEVRLLNRHGDPVHVIEHGDGITIEVSYRVRERVEDPVFGVALMRNDGAYVYGTNTLVERMKLSPLTKDGVFRFHYDRLPVLAGTYRLSIAVLRESQMLLPIHAFDRVHSFRVLAPGDEEGLVRLEHTWSLDPELSPAESDRRIV